MELVHSNEKITPIFREAINNGENHIGDDLFTSVNKQNSTDTTKTYDVPSTFLKQLSILMHRMLIQQSRNKAMLTLQFGYHLLVGLSLGLMLYQIGSDASGLILTAKLCFIIVNAIVFNHIMSPILMCKYTWKMIQ